MKLYWSAIFLCFILHISDASEVPMKKNFSQILMEEFRLYPEMTIQDVYKFIYQSAMGPAHWKMDEAEAKKYLLKEIQQLIPDSTEPIMQSLDETGELVRVNLKAFAAKKLSVDSLVSAVARTSIEFTQSVSVLENRWKIFLELIQTKQLSFNEAEAQLFFNEKKEQQFPAVHHSKIYAVKYSPAYRIIFKKYFPVK